jgi:uncharacterized protein
MKMTRSSIFLLTAMLMSPAIAQTASYTCADASTATERAICASPELGRKDIVVSTYYDVLLRLKPAIPGMAYREFRDRLRNDQQQFLAARDACGADGACLNQRYDDRLTALRATTDHYGAVVFDRPADH